LKKNKGFLRLKKTGGIRTGKKYKLKLLIQKNTKELQKLLSVDERQTSSTVKEIKEKYPLFYECIKTLRGAIKIANQSHLE
jgi:hypothetical protein